MKTKRISLQWVISMITAILVAVSYVIAYYCLNTDLKSIFDEGFFFTCFKPESSFAAFTQPLSLGREVMYAVFPDIGQWDILDLRKLSYWIKIAGLIILLVASVFFFDREKKGGFLSGVSLVSCILLFGVITIPSVVISSNDQLRFFEMIAVAVCFFAVRFDSAVAKALLQCLMGCISFMATLCNAPGGIMLFFLCLLFLVFYPAFSWRNALKTMAFSCFGVVIGLTIMHFSIINISGCLDFIGQALAQTSGTGPAAHHSLFKLFVGFLLNIRNLIITVVSLFGITYVSKAIGKRTGEKWLMLLVGSVLFLIYYKWQVKPEVGFANIMTWLFLMAWFYSDNQGDRQIKDIVLTLFLFLLPFGLSLGSNSGFLFKSKEFIVPWGILLYYWVIRIKDKEPIYSNLLFVVASALIIMGPGRYLTNCLKWDSYCFAQERPVARMHLTEAQYNYYNEVYDILKEYGYVSQRDSLLGFCFNEMTVVAVDAVPYTNDQQPEEFLCHDLENLPRPSFLIMNGWEETLLSPYFSSLTWGFPEDYDIYRLEHNPDPSAGYDNIQSTLYCLKERKRVGL